MTFDNIGDIFFCLLVLGAAIIAIIASASLLKRGTWLLRFIIFIIPSIAVILGIAYAISVDGKSTLSNICVCLLTECVFLGLYYSIIVSIDKKKMLTKTPKYRHLFFKDYGWEEKTHEELVLYYSKYYSDMSPEEMTAIKKKFKQFHDEEDKKGLSGFRSKTGLNDVPSVNNPDRLLRYAASSARKRGWTSTNEIQKEFGIDSERAERILDQLCKLHICGPSTEVHLSVLGENEIGYIFNLGRMGEPFRTSKETKDKAEKIVELYDKKIFLCPNDVEDIYLEIVKKYIEFSGDVMDKEELWRVRDEISTIIGCRKIMNLAKID